MDAVERDIGGTTVWVGPTDVPTRLLRKWLAGGYTAGMRNGEPLTIDVADPASIQKAFTRAQREVEKREVEVRSAVEGLRYWQTMRNRLAALTSGDGATTTKPSGEPIRKQLLRLVNDSPIPVDVDEAHQRIPETKRKTISWTLWDLARRGKIQRITEGLYASLDYEPSTLLGGHAE